MDGGAGERRKGERRRRCSSTHYVAAVVSLQPTSSLKDDAIQVSSSLHLHLYSRIIMIQVMDASRLHSAIQLRLRMTEEEHVYEERKSYGEIRKKVKKKNEIIKIIYERRIM